MLHIPDLHEPWAHPKALDFVCRVQDRFKPDRIIFAGDEIDQHSFSIKYMSDPDLPSPGDELKRAVEEMRKWYLEFPHADLCHSNHGGRILKKALNAGLPRAVIRAYKDILQAPESWNWFDDIVVDNVLYIHGDPYTQSTWRSAYNRERQSVVMGHLHSAAGILYSENRRSKLFVVNGGCLVDSTQLPFAYAQHAKEKVTLGCTMIIDGEEVYFIPMNDRGGFSI